MEPQIARRCPTCGASIREVALFCPQCGNAQPQPRAAAETETTSKNTAPLQGAEVGTPQWLMAATIPSEKSEDASKVPADAQSMSDTVAIERPEETPQPPAGPGMRGAVGAKLQRATTLARDVEGDVIHRVKKVRQMSHVVLDEAGDDPGLRFVLVTAIVFVLFLVIFMLNKLIT
ncbi:MAG: zinc ribbon domain-containing protein [Acidobacteriota bacterium]